jgi:hypothetical protein
MSDEPDNESAIAASATGIVQCLRMLAEEAASLNLRQTLEAIREAMQACAAEGSELPTLAHAFRRHRPLIH